MSLWSLVGIITVIVVFNDFVNRLGKGIPILELMLLIAGLQWIIGPIIEYNFPTNHYKYYMYVEEPAYMGFVVPAYLAFVVAVILCVRPYRSFSISVSKFRDYKDYGLIIFITGFVFDLISGSLPGSLGFFAFLVGNFKFAGAIILFFSEDKQLKYAFYGALVLLLFRAIQAAMFHDFVLWTVFFYMFWAIKYKPSKTQIYLTILIGVFSLSTLQTIKSAYRSEVWNGYRGNKVELFTSLFVDAVLYNESASAELSGEENNVRLNQGWIISAIMDEIPERTAFQNGTTIQEAITASILPRFLNPDKKEAGGRENFMKFTGLYLSPNASMGISIVGEAYVNFGEFGGILFMGIWGLFLGLSWIFLLKVLKINLLFLAFLPLIFLQVVKAETELVVVLNHLIKASIVVFLFFWVARIALNWNFKTEQSSV